MYFLSAATVLIIEAPNNTKLMRDGGETTKELVALSVGFSFCLLLRSMLN